MKKVILILVPLLLIGGGGGVYFAASKGIMQIPGITPKKKAALAQYGEAKDQKIVQKPKPKLQPKKPEPLVQVELNDPAQGRKKLAAVWNELKIESLLKVTESWNTEELALQLATMDPSKVTELLNAMAEKDPKRVSDLSRQIQAIGSKEPPTEEI